MSATVHRQQQERVIFHAHASDQSEQERCSSDQSEQRKPL